MQINSHNNARHIGSIPPGNWHFENINDDLVQAEKYSKVLWESQTKYQEAKIIQGEFFGRSLILDGKTQSTERDEFIYHESLIHPSFIIHKNPKNIFIAGGGEGATAREILKYRTVQNVTMLDIDEEVVSACKKFLVNHHKGSFEDFRLKLMFGDARQYLEITEDKYDIVVIDVPDPLETGPAYKLFTSEFYQLVQSRLDESGILITQAGPTDPTSADKCFTKVFNTISSEFNLSYPYHAHIPAFGTTWGFVIASNTHIADESKGIDFKLEQAGLHDLSMYDEVTHKGLFSLPRYLRQSIGNENHIIKDNDPLFVD